VPELPEVETIVRRFRPLLEGRRITGFDTRWKKQLSPSLAAVRAGCVGRRIVRLARRGKFIVFQLDPPGWLLVHLRMSGRFEWGANRECEPGHLRAIWTFEDSERLLFCDSRKFGRIIYAPDLATATGELGVEPLSRAFTVAKLAALLRRHRRRLKPLLLDQRVIAGLGNIYTDEALFRAGLHPLTASDTLRPPQIAALHAAIRAVLREAIRYQGTTFDQVYAGGDMQRRLAVYGRKDQPCPRCGAAIRYARIGQRGTHFCPRCQPVGGGRRKLTRRAKRQTQAGAAR
jgi:formamidopyrimidine-DNA glycosylase